MRTRRNATRAAGGAVIERHWSRADGRAHAICAGRRAAIEDPVAGALEATA